MFFTNTPDHIQAIFDGLVNSIPANDPILLLGVMEGDIDTMPVADNLKRGLFCFSKRNIFKLEKPDQVGV
jgi:ATPase family AAA domain-containing protein 2